MTRNDASFRRSGRGTSGSDYNALGRDPTRAQEDMRTAAGLLRLKTALAKQIPPKLVDGNLLLATWNVRELGGAKGGGRTEESLHYVAEILSAFDVVAVQEIRDDVHDFRRVLALLGPWWKFMMTDITVGKAGNRERIGFVYDARKVKFEGLASQVVLPPEADADPQQLARTPFFLAMRGGWFDFVVCAAHIYYGTAKRDDPRRVREIEELASFLKRRAEDRTAEVKSALLVGDFNIFDTKDATFERLTRAGFTVPTKLMTSTSNVGHDKHYDQIAFLAPYLAKRKLIESFDAGVFDVFDVVYRDRDEETYAQAMKGSKLKYSQWRTYQMSDHFPMWIEIDTDWSRGFLAERMRGKPRREEAPDASARPAERARKARATARPRRSKLAARRPAPTPRGTRR